MKERPILFTGEMVRAILSGEKTQTRRIVKPQPVSVEEIRKEVGIGYSLFTDHFAPDVFRISGPVAVVLEKSGLKPGYRWKCFFGQVGDRLWVRETFMGWYREGVFSHVAAYKADGYQAEQDERWTPSIHMPRSASRINLEITNIKVERLNDISEQDAKDEGIVGGLISRTGSAGWGSNEGMPDIYKSKWKFAELWESINGVGSWDENPWVWVIEFKRVK